MTDNATVFDFGRPAARQGRFIKPVRTSIIAICLCGLASCNSVPSLPTYSVDFPDMKVKIVPNWDDAVATLPCSDFTPSLKSNATQDIGIFPSNEINRKWQTRVAVVADGRVFEPGEIEDPSGWSALERKFANHIGPGC